MDAEHGTHGAEVVTGDPRVDEAIGRLRDLAELPVAEHPDIFEHVHARLAEALGDLDAQGGATAGDRPRAPGR